MYYILKEERIIKHFAGLPGKTRKFCKAKSEKNVNDSIRQQTSSSMKTAHVLFMLTADKPTTVQTYGHENGSKPFFI